nr:PREDICTED: peroxisomal membrane protein PMP34 isoform X1 [Bemisia tabaci]
MSQGILLELLQISRKLLIESVSAFGLLLLDFIIWPTPLRNIMTQREGLFSYTTLTHAIAGATGGVLATMMFYPLETVKSRLQIEENQRRDNQNSFKIMIELAEEEGVSTLYRGMLPVVQSVCVSSFVYYYTFHGLKTFVKSPSVSKDLILGIVAGSINVLTTTPFWVVNTRLKMKGLRSFEPLRYSSLLGGLKRIYLDEGLGALWRGTGPSLLLTCNPAVQFAIYETLKREIGSNLSAIHYFFLGAFSKCVATILTYPLIFIQNLQRHGHKYKNLKANANALELILYITRTLGIQGLYKGLEAKLLQSVLMAAFVFVTYEKVKQMVHRVLLPTKLVK